MNYSAIYPEYQLAAGNNNAAGLQPIEYILAALDTARPGIPAFPPKAWARYTPGTAKIRGNGVVTFSGYPVAEWPVGFVTRTQARGLMTTYCSSGYSGLVTVRTRTDNPASYANYNAVMILPLLSDFRADQVKWDGYTDYVIRFVRMVAL